VENLVFVYHATLSSIREGLNCQLHCSDNIKSQRQLFHYIDPFNFLSIIKQNLDTEKSRPQFIYWDFPVMYKMWDFFFIFLEKRKGYVLLIGLVYFACGLLSLAKPLVEFSWNCIKNFSVFSSHEIRRETMLWLGL